MDVLVLCGCVEGLANIVKVGKFVAQIVKLVDFVYPLGLESFAGTGHLFV